MAQRNDRIRDEMARRSNAWTRSGDEAGRPHTPNALALPTPSSQRAIARDAGLGAAALIAPSSTASGVGVGTLDGPLPKDAREIINGSVTGDMADQAEIYARRLLSTYRRVRVYREELQAATEEAGDYRALIGKSQLVTNAIQQEMQTIDARIQELMNERNLCQIQFEQEAMNQQRLDGKAQESQQRVDALRSTIDSIAVETQRGQMLLRQLVPNLNIENYA